MKRVRCPYRAPARRTLGWIALWTIAAVPTARGAEEYENFLNGLRQRQYYDMALEYLDVMRNSPLLTEEQRQMVTFEEARTYLDASRSERDNVQRDKMLDGARDRFEKFVKENPEHPQAAGAETELGAVLVERARNKVEQALRPDNSANKAKFLGEAVKLFEESEKVFIQAQEKFNKLLGSFPKFMAPNDPRVPQRERAKGELIKAHLFHAYGLYEKSRAYATGSPEWKKALIAAAEKNNAIYKDYRTLISGLSARLQEGKCYQELGDTKRALGLYNDLLGQPDDLKALRVYKAGAMYQSLQCWTADTEKMYELAGLQGDEFLQGSSPDELQRPEWQAVRYFTAVAHKLRADQLKDAKGEEAKVRDRELDRARELAELVANVTNDYQDQARALLREVTTGGAVVKDREPRSFLEAQNRGTDAMTRFQALMAEAQKLTDAAAQQAKLQEAEPVRQEALDFFAKALKLVDENTSLEDKNVVRYYVCFLNYTSGKTYDTAVLGEFLLKNYPNSGGARGAAMYALAAYVDEYQRNQDALLSDRPGTVKPVNPEFDRMKMYELATAIAGRWKGENEADQAWNILLNIALNERNVADILKTLGNIQETSPLRTEAEMKAGRMLWALYGEQLALDEGAPGKLAAADLQKLAVDANGVLEAALTREKSKLDAVEKLTLQHAETLMFLCESRMALGKNKEALECVDDPKFGLLTLMRNVAKNPAAAGDENAQLAKITLALQAYVLNDKIDDAQKLIGELPTLIKSQSAGQLAQLGNTYLQLALRLQKQIDQFRQTKNIEGLKKAAKGFAFFLDELVKAKEAFEGDARFQNLNWVSQNYFDLGSDLVGQENASAEDKTLGVEFLNKSSALDNDVLGPLTAEGSEAQLVVKLRKARSLRRAEKYDDALTALVEILKDKRFLIEGQIEACETLMERAAKKEEPASYAIAVAGDKPDDKGDNIIWGWKRIADTMARSPQFANASDPSHADFVRLYHQGRFNVALCSYRQALAAQAAEDRTKHMNAVIYFIDATEQAVPDLGGDLWKPKYLELKEKATKALSS